MFLVSYGRSRTWTLPLAGLLTGIGIAAMHYTGMAAMQVQGSIHYDVRLVGLSVVIAVAAATAALWITRTTRRRPAMAGAIPIMALAVCGMHYTGMAAADITLNANAPAPTGASASALVWPMVIWIVGCPLITFLFVTLAPSGEEVLENKHYDGIANRMPSTFARFRSTGRGAFCGRGWPVSGPRASGHISVITVTLTQACWSGGIGLPLASWALS